MVEPRIDVVHDDRSEALLERSLAMTRDRYRPAPRDDVHAGIAKEIARLVDGDPAVRVALEALPGRLTPVTVGLADPGTADLAYTEGTVFKTPPYDGTSWAEGETLQAEPFPGEGRLYLRCGAGATPGGQYGTHGGAMGWSLTFTSPVRARVEVKPWFQYFAEFTLGRMGGGHGSMVGGLRISATGFDGWGGPGFGGGGSFHAEQSRQLFFDVADGEPRGYSYDDTVNDLRLAFTMSPARPTVVRIGSWMSCNAEDAHYFGVPAGDAVSTGWLDTRVKFMFIESHPA